MTVSAHFDSKVIVPDGPRDFAIAASCVLTRDRLFSESAARALKKYPQFCVVLITIPQMRGTEFVETFKAAWRLNPIARIAGQALSWPST